MSKSLFLGFEISTSFNPDFSEDETVVLTAKVNKISSSGNYIPIYERPYL